MYIQPNIVTKAGARTDTVMLAHSVGAFACTPQPNFGKVEVAVVAAAAFDGQALTNTAPSSSGQTLLLFGPNNEEPNLVRITPYSSAADTSGAQLRVLGWTRYQQASNILYVPVLLAEISTLAYNATVGNIPNVSVDGATRHFFHSLTATAGTAPTVNTYTPGTAASANSPPASFVVDTMGCQFVTLHVRATTAATLGALWYAI